MSTRELAGLIPADGWKESENISGALEAIFWPDCNRPGHDKADLNQQSTSDPENSPSNASSVKTKPSDHVSDTPISSISSQKSVSILNPPTTELPAAPPDLDEWEVECRERSPKRRKVTDIPPLAPHRSSRVRKPSRKALESAAAADELSTKATRRKSVQASTFRDSASDAGEIAAQALSTGHDASNSRYNDLLYSSLKHSKVLLIQPFHVDSFNRHRPSCKYPDDVVDLSTSSREITIRRQSRRQSKIPVKFGSFVPIVDALSTNVDSDIDDTSVEDTSYVNPSKTKVKLRIKNSTRRKSEPLTRFSEISKAPPRRRIIEDISLFTGSSPASLGQLDAQKSYENPAAESTCMSAPLLKPRKSKLSKATRAMSQFLTAEVPETCVRSRQDDSHFARNDEATYLSPRATILTDAVESTPTDGLRDVSIQEALPPNIPDVIPQDDVWLVNISQGLIHASIRNDKPDPIGQPDVWADGRQALCETLPYYRAYQGAGYCTGGYAMSFMFDRECGTRDYMDADVVLARAGGGLFRDKLTGGMVQGKDQSENSQVKSIRNNITHKCAVAIITGDQNPRSPSKVPHPYCIMDWFKPTHIWCEKSKGKVMVRYRFEKLKIGKQSWWTPADQLQPITVGALQPPEVQQCGSCQRSSQRVYLQGWMCLHSDCGEFWKLKTGKEPQEEGLIYDPRFLKQSTPWPHATEPQPLKPTPMILDARAPTLGQAVSWVAWKGLVCPLCGRCSSRESWVGWTCGNTSCNFEHHIEHTIIPSTTFRDYYCPITSDYAPTRDYAAPEVTVRVEFAYNYRIHYYEIPGIEGFVAHFIANKTVNEEPGGPDDMFTELQAKDIGLRRRPLQSTTLRGGQLTQHFAVNYGMFYKFVAATTSKPFSEAAKAVKNTRSRLNWAARYILGERHSPEFNEELVIGYFEKQAIDYHDDGEKGLGPTIGTLSLGWPAAMFLRMKAKHFNGLSRQGNYVEDAPLPSSLKYEERMAAWQGLQALRQTDMEAYRRRLKELSMELGLKSKGNAKDCINLHLSHGDMVIMHGEGIQKYYEHAVTPSGNLRFALTCRYIDPESLSPQDRPNYEVEPDDGHYDGAALPAPPV